MAFLIIDEVKGLCDAAGRLIQFEFDTPAMRAVMSVAMQGARMPASILITGESGTGKSVLARVLHEESRLADKPFVTMNCPGLSRELLDSELFGHVQGFFTEGVNHHWGKVNAADAGTLFLDEVGDLPLEIQSKLLRLLQQHEYERVGENVTRRAVIRIIAATHRDLKKLMQQGKFREDLYFRLNEIAVDLPPLRRRRADLIRLANHYLKHFSQSSGRNLPALSKAAAESLMDYAWPGNLRELRNALEGAVNSNTGDEVTLSDLPTEITGDPTPGEDQLQPGAMVSLERLEELHIRRVVERTSSVSEAARVLGINQATIYRKRKQKTSRLLTAA